MSRDGRDKKSCLRAYGRHLKKMAPKYKYHFRLWCSSDLPDIADSWSYRSNSIDELIETQYPQYAKGEKHLKDSPATRHSSQSELQANLTKIFTKYQDMTDGAEDEPDIMFDDAHDSFFRQVLKHEPTNVNRLIFATIMEIPTLTEITRKQFVDGLKAYGLSSEGGIATFFSTAVKNLTGATLFAKDLYSAAFYYANGSRDRKTLAVKRAIAFWNMLIPVFFPQSQTLGDWTTWLEAVMAATPEEFGKPTTWLVRGDATTGDETELKWDLWQNFYDFCDKMRDDYVANYDFDGGDAWNTALDQFVFDFLDLEYVNEPEMI